MKTICILSLILSSCHIGVDCDIKAKGMCIIFESESTPKEHIIRSVDILQEGLDLYFESLPKLPKIFRKYNVVVIFVDYNMYKDCVLVERDLYECQDIDGVNYSSSEIFVEWRECIGITAFIHELLHTIEKDLYNISKSNHQGPFFDDNMKNKYEAIENKTNARIMYELCMER